MIKATFKTTEKDLGWKKLKSEIIRGKNHYVDIGVFSDAGQYSKGKKKVNIADVATFNEFGTRRIPPRPFTAQTFDKNKTTVDNFIKKQIQLILDGKETVATALERIGIYYESKVKSIFRTGTFKPNKPSTIKRKTKNGKKGDRPLIDNSVLRKSITYKVSK
jgi:hypothetical protein